MGERPGDQGSCCCGAVAFELAKPPTMMATCHCARCRKLGASTFVSVRREAFRSTRICSTTNRASATDFTNSPRKSPAGRRSVTSRHSFPGIPRAADGSRGAALCVGGPKETVMGDAGRDEAADKLNRKGEEPAAESGAGYGDHAVAPEDQHEDETASE